MNFVFQLLSFEVESHPGSLSQRAMPAPSRWCSLSGWLHKQYSISAETESEHSGVLQKESKEERKGIWKETSGRTSEIEKIMDLEEHST